MLSDRRQLLKDRVKLIRAMQDYLHNSSTSVHEFNTLKLVIDRIRSDKESFLSRSQERETFVSYASKPQHKYDTSKRYRTTLGRYLRRNLSIPQDNLSDANIEDLSYRVMGYTKKNIDRHIKILRGKDITKAYKNRIGYETCMTGGNAYKVELYELNPDKIGLAVFKNQARALLWTCDDGTTVLDRIYPNKGIHVEIMIKWAKENGYVYRSNQYCGSCSLSDYEEHKITLKANEYFPYMDTFMWGRYKKDGMFVVSNNNSSGDYELTSTEGVLEDSVACYHCGDRIFEDNAQQSADGYYYCPDCYDEIYSHCYHCDQEIYREDAYFEEGDAFCKSCYDELFATYDDCDRSLPRGDLILVDGEYLCDSCIKEQGRQIELFRDQRTLDVVINVG